MTNFIYDFTETGITIQTDTYCHYFDCVKTASDAAYALLKGETTEDWDNNQVENRVDEYHGDQDDLKEIVENYNELKDECDAFFAAAFFEEVMLLHLLNGDLNE